MLLQGFPATGVTVFGSQLHTHGTGARVTTRHVRNGVELAEINRDDHYSTHFQVRLSAKVPRRNLTMKNRAGRKIIFPWSIHVWRTCQE